MDGSKIAGLLFRAAERPLCRPARSTSVGRWGISTWRWPARPRAAVAALRNTGGLNFPPGRTPSTVADQPPSNAAAADLDGDLERWPSAVACGQGLTRPIAPSSTPPRCPERRSAIRIEVCPMNGEDRAMEAPPTWTRIGIPRFLRDRLRRDTTCRTASRSPRGPRRTATTSGFPDPCGQIASGSEKDCDLIRSARYKHASGTADRNGIPDVCDLARGTASETANRIGIPCTACDPRRGRRSPSRLRSVFLGGARPSALAFREKPRRGTGNLRDLARRPTVQLQWNSRRSVS
jgi:hypothetical protein